MHDIINSIITLSNYITLTTLQSAATSQLIRQAAMYLCNPNVDTAVVHEAGVGYNDLEDG